MSDKIEKIEQNEKVKSYIHDDHKRIIQADILDKFPLYDIVSIIITKDKKKHVPGRQIYYKIPFEYFSVEAFTNKDTFKKELRAIACNMDTDLACNVDEDISVHNFTFVKCMSCIFYTDNHPKNAWYIKDGHINDW
jgi:hypothetical protein